LNIIEILPLTQAAYPSVIVAKEEAELMPILRKSPVLYWTAVRAWTQISDETRWDTRSRTLGES